MRLRLFLKLGIKTVSQETVLSYEPDAVMGRNMIFSENPWGQLALGMKKIKSQFIPKKLLSQQFSKIWEYRRRCQNLGMIFNVQDKGLMNTQHNYKLKLTLLRKQIQHQGEKKKALIMVAYNHETFGATEVCFAEKVC